MVEYNSKKAKMSTILSDYALNSEIEDGQQKRQCGYTFITFNLLCNSVQRHIIQRSPTIDITFVSHPNGQCAVGYFDPGDYGILPVSVSSQHKRVGQLLTVYNGV